MSKPVFNDLFTFSGRRNRLSYFLFFLAALVPIIVFYLIIMANLGSGADPGAGTIFALLIMAAVSFVMCIVGAQRCRDFGWTGWAILLTAVPFVGWIFGIALYFIPGNQGDNRYGPDPLAESASLGQARETSR